MLNSLAGLKLNDLIAFECCLVFVVDFIKCCSMCKYEFDVNLEMICMAWVSYDNSIVMMC